MSMHQEPTIALMIDIETLSLKPTAYVTQVGVCVANLETREYIVKPENYWLDNMQPRTADKDIDTIKWWMGQSDGARSAVFKAPHLISSLDLFAILREYARPLDGDAVSVWGSPAMFDLPVLTHLFGGQKPWDYARERDLMTLYKLIDPCGALAPPANELQHDAASDAHWQMEYLLNLHANLRETQACAHAYTALQK